MKLTETAVVHEKSEDSTGNLGRIVVNVKRVTDRAEERRKGHRNEPREEEAGKVETGTRLEANHKVRDDGVDDQLDTEDGRVDDGLGEEQD